MNTGEKRRRERDEGRELVKMTEPQFWFLSTGEDGRYSFTQYHYLLWKKISKVHEMDWLQSWFNVMMANSCRLDHLLLRFGPGKFAPPTDGNFHKPAGNITGFNGKTHTPPDQHTLCVSPLHGHLSPLISLSHSLLFIVPSLLSPTFFSQHHHNE